MTIRRQPAYFNHGDSVACHIDSVAACSLEVCRWCVKETCADRMAGLRKPKSLLFKRSKADVDCPKGQGWSDVPCDMAMQCDMTVTPGHPTGKYSSLYHINHKLNLRKIHVC